MYKARKEESLFYTPIWSWLPPFLTYVDKLIAEALASGNCDLGPVLEELAQLCRSQGRDDLAAKYEQMLVERAQSL